MSKSIKLLYILSFLCAGLYVQAQRGSTMLTVNYNVGIPTGGLKTVAPSTSFRGFEGNLLFGVSDHVSVGLGTAFQDFYQKNSRQVYKTADGSDVSAVVSYSIQTMPILARAKYNFNPGAPIQPYAGLGLGANMISYNQLLGEFGDEQASFKFAAKPELGVFVPFKRGGEAGFNVGASYNIMPYGNNEVGNLNHVGVHAGVSVPLKRF